MTAAPLPSLENVAGELDEVFSFAPLPSLENVAGELDEVFSFLSADDGPLSLVPMNPTCRMMTVTHLRTWKEKKLQSV